MQLGLFFFASSGSGRDTYRLMLDAARLVDRHDFCAVWTPERHFGEFGASFPNPALTSAALAMVTENVQLRAGSLVLPLHHPLRVVEDWSVVDNLSGGRAAVSFGSGWHADDFALAPESYQSRYRDFEGAIRLVLDLWAGNSGRFVNGVGECRNLSTQPRPVQRTLPFWVTSSRSPQTVRLAARLGGNLLTHMLGQDVDVLKDRIDLYREERERHGHDPAAGIVSVMLHTYVGSSRDEAHQEARGPLRTYVGEALSLEQINELAHRAPDGLHRMGDDDREALLSAAVDRFLDRASLIGDVQDALRMATTLQDIGVTEIACLVDFGLPADKIMESLERLCRVRALLDSPWMTAWAGAGVPGGAVS